MLFTVDTLSVIDGQSPRRVLVVDDDEGVLALLKAILEAGGFSVTAASGGGAAVRVAAENGGVDLLVTDIEMPDKTGIEVAEELSLKQPDLPVLFITGGIRAEEVRNWRGRRKVLQKPFDARAVLASVHQLLNSG
jgi:CheY-like chemotaxis protein